MNKPGVKTACGRFRTAHPTLLTACQLGTRIPTAACDIDLEQYRALALCGISIRYMLSAATTHELIARLGTCRFRS
ncbi:hypothetical protein WP4W18C03_10780 [Pseudomonas putida]|nr:hypothetical protein WP4W18C03_10780 [Pseudomonas putida]